MGLSDYKINSFSKPVSALDDTPKMSASELKEWFDSNSTNELKKSVNGIIDELKDVDINKQHTHDNKDILDAINEEPIYDTVSDGKLYARKDGAWSEFGDLPSISTDELDTFLDGVGIVKGDKYFVYDGEGTGEFISGSVYEIESECYALCIANCEYEGDHWWYSQVLLFANGETYTRYKEDYYCWDENDENYGTLVYSEWSAWKRIKAYSAYNADNAVKAQKDGKGNIISDTYIKNTDYATKDVAGVVKVNKDSGIKFADNKTLMIVAADEEAIDKGTSSLRPITPNVLKYAVKSVTYDKAEIDNTYATKEELADSKKWKTLMDITLTEEQAGVNEIALAIEDVEAFLNARQIRIAMSFPVAEAREANTFYTTIRVKDKAGTAYNITFLAAQNAKGGANATYYATAQIDLFDFAYNNNYTRSFQSIMQTPTPHYTVSANTVKAPSNSTGGFYVNAIRLHQPYVYFTFSGNQLPTFEAGAHIFMEVCD